MRRSTLIGLPVVLLSLAASAASLHAQSGPTGPNPSLPSIGPVSPSNGNPTEQHLTPESLAAYLRSQGMTVEPPTTLSSGGARLIAKQQKDGWTYEVEIEFTSTRKSYWLLAKLRPVAGYSQAQLVNLLKTTWKIDPVHFVVNGETLYLCDGAWNTTNTPQQFMNNFNNFTKAVRDSYSAWAPTN